LEQAEFQKLMKKAIDNTISAKDAQRLREALAPKFIDNKYNSKEERLIISAYALFNDPTRRKAYIDKVLAQWRIDSLARV